MNQQNAEKTVGVIGGMGPYATLAFFRCVLDRTATQKDWEHLHLIIDNNPKIPSRTRAFLYGEADPVPMMVASANMLRDAGADFVVLPCNSAHYFLPRVREQTDVPFLDMIDETSRRILAGHRKVVGVLAGEVTVKAALYESRLVRHRIDVLQVTDDEQRYVRGVIEDVKQNRVCDATTKTLETLIHTLERRGADAVVLGCTELPMAMAHVQADCEMIDSMAVLAEAVVEKARMGAGILPR